MKLPPVDYRRPDSLPEVLDALAEAGDDAAVLAGGQSLLIDLRYGVAGPALLVDINGVRELDVLDARDGMLRIGALTRHAAFEGTAVPGPLGRLLRSAAAYVAHPPIRAVGTFVGSVAWGHPAAEWCAAVAGLEGEVVLRSAAGERVVPAAEWFRGPLRTARLPGELVTEVRLPLPAAGAGVGFAEHRRTHASFAQVAVHAVVTMDGDRVAAARVGLAGAAEVPLRAVAAEGCLAGSDGGADAVAAAGAAAARECDPVAEQHCPADYRRHVVGVMVRRAVDAAVREARQEAAACG